jgi:predicted transcriptional regulator
LQFDFTLKADQVATQFKLAVEAQIQAFEAQMLRVIHALTPLQLAVLCVLAAQGEKYAPFEEATLAAYKKALKTHSPSDKTNIDVSNVQQALLALQEKSLVWKEKRGVYALEESHTAELLEQAHLLSWQL